VRRQEGTRLSDETTPRACSRKQNTRVAHRGSLLPASRLTKRGALKKWSHLPRSSCPRWRNSALIRPVSQNS